jgi:hypothetical protein
VFRHAVDADCVWCVHGKTAAVCAYVWCRPGCPPEWVDKLEQRLAVAVAIGAGSHITGAAPVPLGDAARRQLQAEAGIAPGQPGALLEMQPPPDPQPARLLDEQGLVVCLSDPLQVKYSTPKQLSRLAVVTLPTARPRALLTETNSPVFCRGCGGRRGGRCGTAQTTCAHSAAQPALAASQPWSGAESVLDICVESLQE